MHLQLILFKNHVTFKMFIFLPRHCYVHHLQEQISTDSIMGLTVLIPVVNWESSSCILSTFALP